jgi:cytidylate kinase
MDIRYLTVEREYGSGGTEIARRVSANTGVRCYGAEIIERASRRLNMSVDELEKYEEKVTGSFLYTLYMMAQAHSYDSDMLTKEGKIFVEEQSEIQSIARQGSAIFLGHCASEALKENEGVIKVFIRCTDERQKRARIVKEYGIAESQVESVRETYDKKRANYYYANTQCKWKDFSKYDIVLDSAKLGIDGCAALLSGLMCC